MYLMPKCCFHNLGSPRLDETVVLNHCLVLCWVELWAACFHCFHSYRWSLRLHWSVFNFFMLKLNVPCRYKSVTIQLLWTIISLNLTLTSVPFSVQNSKDLGVLLLTGLLEIFTGPIIPECIGSATIQLIGLVWDIPSM